MTFLGLQSLFYGALGVLGAMPLVMMVAAVRQNTIAVARRRLLTFFRDWAGMAPRDLHRLVRATVGFSGAFVFFVAFAFLADRVAAAVADPVLRLWPLPSEATSWQLSHQSEWSTFRSSYENSWRHYTGKSDWELDRHVFELGRWRTRAARTATLLCVLAAFAGAYDCYRSPRFRRRGMATFLTALVLTVATCSIWSLSEGRFVKSLATANRALPSEFEVDVPASLPPSAR